MRCQKLITVSESTNQSQNSRKSGAKITNIRMGKMPPVGEKKPPVGFWAKINVLRPSAGFGEINQYFEDATCGGKMPPAGEKKHLRDFGQQNTIF